MTSSFIDGHLDVEINIESNHFVFQRILISYIRQVITETIVILLGWVIEIIAQIKTYNEKSWF